MPRSAKTHFRLGATAAFFLDRSANPRIDRLGLSGNSYAR